MCPSQRINRGLFVISVEDGNVIREVEVSYFDILLYLRSLVDNREGDREESR